MIDHILIYVSNLSKSKDFYIKTFTPFGYSVSFGEEKSFWSFDIGNGAFFEIAQHNGDKLTPCHIAFRAKRVNVKSCVSIHRKSQAALLS